MVRPLFPNVFTTYPQPIPQWIPADLCVRRDRQDGTAQSRLHLEGSKAVGEHESQVARPGTLALNQLEVNPPKVTWLAGFKCAAGGERLALP